MVFMNRLALILFCIAAIAVTWLVVDRYVFVTQPKLASESTPTDPGKNTAVSLPPQTKPAIHPSASASATLIVLGRYKDALALANDALKANDSDPFAWRNKAEALIGLKQLDEAGLAIKKSLSIDPTDLPAWITLGNLLGLRGDFDNALTCFKFVLKHDPKNLSALAAVKTIESRKTKP